MASYDNHIVSFCKKLFSEGYPISDKLLDQHSTTIISLIDRKKHPDIISLNLAFEQAKKNDIGWKNKLFVKNDNIDTEYVMFKYKDNDGNDKICECVVNEDKIIRIIDTDYETYYNITIRMQEIYKPTLEKIKMLHSKGFPIHPKLLNSIIPSSSILYRTPNNHNNYEAFLITKTIEIGIEHAIPVPAAYYQTDYSMFKYLDDDSNEKICSCIIKEGQIIHISSFDCEESGYGNFSLID